jgi:hypothetical protein
LNFTAKKKDNTVFYELYRKGWVGKRGFYEKYLKVSEIE